MKTKYGETGKIVFEVHEAQVKFYDKPPVHKEELHERKPLPELKSNLKIVWKRE